MRTWKQYYTVLSGPELCFYKDRKDFQQVNISTYVAIFVQYYALTTYISTNKGIVICVQFSTAKLQIFGSIFSIELCNFTLFYSLVEPLLFTDKTVSTME